MIRGKEDINKEYIMASIKVLSKTVECKKPTNVKVIDKLLTICLYGVIVAITVISVILIG